jgi:16S rRNA U516 pseudouridylate synthase RsuA-like enzyme
MCEAVGHPVRSLKRVGFGPLQLGDLREGAHRRLTEAEVRRLREAPRTAG